jgi:hypothetical protein
VLAAINTATEIHILNLGFSAGGTLRTRLLLPNSNTPTYLSAGVNFWGAHLNIGGEDFSGPCGHHELCGSAAWPAVGDAVGCTLGKFRPLLRACLGGSHRRWCYQSFGS